MAELLEKLGRNSGNSNLPPSSDRPGARAGQKIGAGKRSRGTSWLRAGTMLSPWTIATSLATVFKILPSGRADTLRPPYGKLRGILVSDRATALNFWAMERRQVCWAHLLGKFVSFEDRAGPAGDIGRELLEYTGVVFRYWQTTVTAS